MAYMNSTFDSSFILLPLPLPFPHAFIFLLPFAYTTTTTSLLSPPLQCYFHLPPLCPTLVLPPPPKNFNLLFHEKSLTQGFGIFTHNNTNFSLLKTNPKILKCSHRARFHTKNHYFRRHHHHLPSFLPFAITFPSTRSL